MMHVMNAHMIHALMHWNLSNFTLETINWLENRVLVQKPQIWKTQFQKINQIDQLTIILVRKHHIMT